MKTGILPRLQMHYLLNNGGLIMQLKDYKSVILSFKTSPKTRQVILQDISNTLANIKFFSVLPESISIDNINAFKVKDAKWIFSSDKTYKSLAILTETSCGKRWIHIYSDDSEIKNISESIYAQRKESITVAFPNIYFYPYSIGGRGISLRSCGVFIVK